MRNLNAGDVISVKHYSGISPFKSIIVDIKENFVTVKLTKEFAVMNFLEGDPIVFGYEREGDIFVFGSNIVNIYPKEDTVVLAVDKIETGAERRQYERFPVSLYADLRVRDSRKKSLATIKDISHYGMLLYSKTDLPLNEVLDLDIYLDKAMIFVKANVIRKAEREHYFEYGLGIVYEDKFSLNHMKEYIVRLQREQKESILRLKNK